MPPSISDAERLRQVQRDFDRAEAAFQQVDREYQRCIAETNRCEELYEREVRSGMSHARQRHRERAADAVERAKHMERTVRRDRDSANRRLREKRRYLEEEIRYQQEMAALRTTIPAPQEIARNISDRNYRGRYSQYDDPDA